MVSPLSWLLTLLLFVTSSVTLSTPVRSDLDSRATKGFSYNSNHFLLNGSPYQIIGGQMDPQRVPRAYWADRLKMARAMGLNTIFSYVYWNKLEPREGEWNFDDNNDIAEYFRLAQSAGLKVVLRPGPYICGEREWGGFPSWLTQIDGMVVRSNNAPFLKYAGTYLDKLGEQVGGLQANTGGPIIMVQLENEYGFYGENNSNDKAYLSALNASLKRNFQVPIYSNDGGSQQALDAGGLPGVLAQTDGDPNKGFPARNKYVTDKSRLGPLLCGEYYVTWIDDWGSNNAHRTDNGDSKTTQKVLNDLEFVLKAGNSISFYMFHGGTNFGFDNGAEWKNNAYAVVTTSYDYGAPLDESGRPTDIYYKIRDVIAKHVPKGSIPAVPQVPGVASVGTVELKPVAALFNTRGSSIATSHAASKPKDMESLGQSYGYLLYQYAATAAHAGALQPGDQARDRVIVFVNGRKVGVIDNRYTNPNKVSVTLAKGDVLQLLVENLGRANFGKEIVDQRKGIVGDVRVNGKVLTGWTMWPVELDQLPSSVSSAAKEISVDNSGIPVFYSGQFNSPSEGGGTAGRDTFIEVNNGVHGVLFVNGVNLGRYWVIGPQLQLYVPGSVLKGSGQVNQVVVLELEPRKEHAIAIKGLNKRTWGNNPDPDRS